MKWGLIYKNKIKKAGGVKRYIENKIKREKQFVKIIKKYADLSPGYIVEAGCGTAIISFMLASMGYHVVALDKDREMLQLAKSLSCYFPNAKGKIKFIRGNILHFPKINNVNIIFSKGVLEHFNDSKIINILQQQLRLSNYVIFSVPSSFFKGYPGEYGNERFLDKKSWRSIIENSGGNIIEEFGTIGSTSDFKLKFAKFLDTVSFGILPLTKPFIGFVIKGWKNKKGKKYKER
jgi:SAM-dependent methyltransferase